MPSGSFDLDSSQPPLAGPALQVGVFRYDPEAAEGEDGDGPFELLPNVRCLRVDVREGPEPPAAQFEYVLDDTLAVNLGWPSRSEQVWPMDAQGPYVVSPDDRVVVMAQNPDGSPLIFFDGFAQVPQADLSPQGERVTFAAVGVAARAFDDVITGRVQRDADTPEDTSGDSDFKTDLPCRFNPSSQAVGTFAGLLGNSTPDANFTEDKGNVAIRGGTGLGDFPVFIEPHLTEREVVDEEPPDTYVAPWYVSDALKYLLSQPNPGDDYLSYPAFAQLDKLLSARYPPPGSGTFNPATAVQADIMIRDYDATNRPLPDALAELLGYCGFVMSWQTTADSDGLPQTALKLYRRDAAASGSPKPVYLAPAGTNTLDPSKNNVAQLHLARDLNAVVNAWQVETAQRQVEITVVLAPLYQPVAGDEASSGSPTSGRNPFKLANLTGADTTTRRKYRWYGADETGDGHWNCAEDEQSFEVIDLSPVFPDRDDGTRGYVRRYRPGSRTLISRDPQGRPLKATLEVYVSQTSPATSPDPYLETEKSSLTWLTIPHGWRLLEDRLGIELTVEDPEDWATGNPALAKINGITWWANPPADFPNGGQPPVLRLTTVIEDDLRLPIQAPKRVASPTQFARWRSADARDHFEYDEVSQGSPYYGGQTWPDKNNPGVIRDDTKLAQTHANQLRAAHEMPPLAGSLTIPYITVYYEVGDRISEVDGRDASLQTNVGASAGEAPTYPVVVGISWTFEPDRQSTTLQLSDRRAEVRNAW
jgi:hypothetical protein